MPLTRPGFFHNGHAKCRIQWRQPARNRLSIVFWNAIHKQRLRNDATRNDPPHRSRRYRTLRSKPSQTGTSIITGDIFKLLPIENSLNGSPTRLIFKEISYRRKYLYVNHVKTLTKNLRDNSQNFVSCCPRQQGFGSTASNIRCS